MSESKCAYTPGPWTVKATNFITYIKADTGHKEIAVMYAESGVEKRANAHLVAAAPDLLEALKYLLELGGDDDRRIAAEAAIAKAEGREY